MYITNDDFEKIEWAIDYLISEVSDYHLKNAHAGTKDRCFQAYCVLQQLKAKKAKDNARQNAYIKGKRKTDPKYFRSQKDWERYYKERR